MSAGPIAPPGGGIAPLFGPVGAPSQTVTNTPALPLTALAKAAAASGDASLAAVTADAIAAQDSLAPLLADLAAALASPALPQAARTIAQQILSLRPPLDQSSTGEALRAAMGASGLFLEAQVGRSILGAQAPDLSGDLKALLLRLPAQLTDPSRIAAAMQGAAPPPKPAAARRSPARPPPPAGGAPLTGQPAARASIDARADPANLGQVLSHEAEAALARLQLLQIASLPKAGEPLRWAFELPVATSAGLGVAQFEIRRDDAGPGQTPGAEPVWRARFSLELEPDGPLHAEVALSPERTRVTLWTDSEGLRARLSEDQPELVTALGGPDGADAAVRVLPGAPGPPPAQAGRLVDRRT